MSWIQVRAEFPPEMPDTSLIVEAFRAFGVENTLEEKAAVTGCITDVPGAVKVANELAEALRGAGATQVFLSPLPEDDWDAMWRQFFKPRRVGKRFVIQPSWEQSEAGSEDLEIVLDPGQAFGTGDHPTTRMCLELLEGLDLDGKTVLDLGCGSGILAIAAAKLGAKVYASDVDLIAIEVTRENAARNRVSIEAWAGEGLVGAPVPNLTDVPQDEKLLDAAPDMESRPVSRSYDLVLSNIISATLIRLARDAFNSVAPGGGWIVSGIIEANWPDVEKSALATGFRLLEQLQEDGWVAARFAAPTVGE